ncbi:MAG: Hpt domain-containing protein [Pseudomonadota bacterium]
MSGAGAGLGHDLPVLDEDQLGELFDGADRDLFEVLEQSAEEDAALHFGALQGHPDAEAAAAACHAIKGTAGSLGFSRAAAIAERLMLAAEAGEAPAGDAVQALDRAWRDGLAAFRNFGAGLPAA